MDNSESHPMPRQNARRQTSPAAPGGPARGPRCRRQGSGPVPGRASCRVCGCAPLFPVRGLAVTVDHWRGQYNNAGAHNPQAGTGARAPGAPSCRAGERGGAKDVPQLRETSRARRSTGAAPAVVPCACGGADPGAPHPVATRGRATAGKEQKEKGPSRTGRAPEVPDRPPSPRRRRPPRRRGGRGCAARASCRRPCGNPPTGPPARSRGCCCRGSCGPCGRC